MASIPVKTGKANFVPQLSLVERIESHLRRQITWLQEATEDVRSLEEHLTEDALETLIFIQQRHQKQIEHLARERNGLLHEWRNATEHDPDAKKRIDALGQQADQLRDQLQEQYQKGFHLAQARLTQGAAGLKQLQKTREIFRKYNVGGITPPDYLDKKA